MDRIQVLRHKSASSGEPTRCAIIVVLPTVDGDIQLEVPAPSEISGGTGSGTVVRGAVVSALERLQKAIASPSNAGEFRDL